MDRFDCRHHHLSSVGNSASNHVASAVLLPFFILPPPSLLFPFLPRKLCFILVQIENSKIRIYLPVVHFQISFVRTSRVINDWLAFAKLFISGQWLMNGGKRDRNSSQRLEFRPNATMTFPTRVRSFFSLFRFHSLSLPRAFVVDGVSQQVQKFDLFDRSLKMIRDEFRFQREYRRRSVTRR